MKIPDCGATYYLQSRGFGVSRDRKSGPTFSVKCGESNAEQSLAFRYNTGEMLSERDNLETEITLADIAGEPVLEAGGCGSGRELQLEDGTRQCRDCADCKKKGESRPELEVLVLPRVAIEITD